MTFFSHIAKGVTLAASILAMPLNAWAGPEAELWEHWQTHDPASTQTVDHMPWTDILKNHVVQQPDGTYLFDYTTIAFSDRKPLKAYLKTLKKTPVSTLNRAEQFAYWVNLYNALTIKVIVDHYPIESIRDIDISPGIFTDGPWGKKLVVIEGEAVSLDDIEHRILRPIWRDPRIHYAVNCASIGCPDLFPEAVTPAKAEAYLDRGARAYINHPRGARVDDGRLTVSSIYDWFQEDFGDSDEGVIAHLKQYANKDLLAALEGITSISSDHYDWALNATSLPDDFIAAKKAANAYRLRGGS